MSEEPSSNVAVIYFGIFNWSEMYTAGSFCIGTDRMSIPEKCSWKSLLCKPSIKHLRYLQFSIRIHNQKKKKKL